MHSNLPSCATCVQKRQGRSLDSTSLPSRLRDHCHSHVLITKHLGAHRILPAWCVRRCRAPQLCTRTAATAACKRRAQLPWLAPAPLLEGMQQGCALPRHAPSVGCKSAGQKRAPRYNCCRLRLPLSHQWCNAQAAAHSASAADACGLYKLQIPVLQFQNEYY